MASWWLAGALAACGCGSDEGSSTGSGHAGAGGAGATGGTTGDAAGGVGGVAGTAGTSAAGTAGTGGTAGAAGAAGTAGTGTGGTGGSVISDAGSFDLTGTWAAKVEVTAIVVGTTLKSTQYYLSQMTQTGTDVAYSIRVCDYTIPSVPGVAEISVPPALKQIIKNKVVSAQGAFLSGTEPGASYSPPRQVTLLGANLANPETDPLPTQQNQATAIDEDGDGNPGVSLDATVLLCPGTQQLYVALRLGATLHGTVLDSSTITGTADTTSEQSVLGYSNPCLAASSSIQVDIQPGSPLKDVRIDGQYGSPDLDSDTSGDITCDELVAQIDVAFPP
jgi:hypothetical protein